MKIQTFPAITPTPTQTVADPKNVEVPTSNASPRPLANAQSLSPELSEFTQNEQPVNSFPMNRPLSIRGKRSIDSSPSTLNQIDRSTAPRMPVRALSRANLRKLESQRRAAATQAQAYEKKATQVASAFPVVHDAAKKWAEEEIKKLTGKEVNADAIYFNRFEGGESGSGTGTVTGWEHTNVEPVRSQTVPEALLSNFSEHDWIPGTLDAEAGLYTDGPGQSQKGGYGKHNEFPLAPSVLMHSSWKTDFQGRFTQQTNDFWKARGDDYRTLLKGGFIASARQQLKAYKRSTPAERARMPDEHKFTRDDYRIVMGAASNVALDENTALSLEQLQAQAPTKGKVRAHAFNINGKTSSDIVRFTAQDDGKDKSLNGQRDGVQILHIRGAKPEFLRFESFEKLSQWVVEQGRDPQKHKALAAHFSLADRQDGGGPSTFESILSKFSPITWIIESTGSSSAGYGVDSALDHLGSHDLNSQEGKIIDSKNVSIPGDVFSYVKNATQERMTSDADTAIKSNSEVTRDTWLNDVSAASRLLVGLAPLALPVAAAAAVVSTTEAALGVEKSIEGDTQAERRDGSGKAFEGVLNTLFSVAGAAGQGAEDFVVAPKEELPQTGPVLDNPVTAKVPTPAGKKGFYLHLADARKIEFKGTTYYAAQRPDAGDGEHFLLWVRDPKKPVELISSGKIAKPDAEGVWRRRGETGGGNERIGQASSSAVQPDQGVASGGVARTISVELPMDGVENFPRENGAPAFYTDDMREVRFDNRIGAWREVIHDEQLGDVRWRTASGRWGSGTAADYLKVRDSLPESSAVQTLNITIPAVPQDAQLLKKEINYIWIGGPITEERVELILHNANQSPGYTSVVHVDANSEQVFQQVKAELEGKAGNLQVRNLHEDPFFASFKASHAGEVYDYFRQGQGLNYSAASDALRYPLINRAEGGGIYMDSDDMITGPVGEVELKAAPGDVLLNGHVSFENANFVGYNTSIFASHPNNPLLEDMSTQMYERFQQNKAWLAQSRPHIEGGSVSEAFKTYQTKIFEVAGPELFNDVLKAGKPDSYNLSFELSDPQWHGVVLSDADDDALSLAHTHYLAFYERFPVVIGSDNSMARVPVLE